MLARFSCASSRAAAFSAHAAWALAAAALAAAALASGAFAANTIPPIRREKTRNKTRRRTVASMTPEIIRVRGYFKQVLKLPAQQPHRTATAPSGNLPHGTVPVRSAWRVLAPMQTVSKAARGVNG